MMNSSAPTSPEEWRRYWQSKGYSWRTEPKIDVKREEELSKCRSIVPDIKKGIYPFKEMKLSRADIEWLLATHENGRGPIIWSDERQRGRAGIDLRGADLRGSEEHPLHLMGLPLSCLHGGLSLQDLTKEGKSFIVATEEQQNLAGILLKGVNLSKIHLEGADLSGAHLEGADLSNVYLEEANLSFAHLEEANLSFAHLEGADLVRAHLEEANLSFAHLEGADLVRAHLEGADLVRAHLEGTKLRETYLKDARLSGASLEGVDLSHAHLKGADLGIAYLERANLSGAHLEGADLSGARLERANLSGAYLENANLNETCLEEANLSGAHLENAYLFGAHLERVDLTMAYLEGNVLKGSILVDGTHVGPQVADIQWGETNLNVVDWSEIATLGDEYQARQKQDNDGANKDKIQRLEEYKIAVRANRQIAVALQDQGLNEDAARFAYRAQVLQRKVLWKQRSFWKWSGSAILALLAGYGYRMARILIAYVIIVLLCAGAYYLLGMYYEPHLSFLDALLTSITAFHGRVFSEPFLHPGALQLWVTAFEAVMGLVIEGVFIAMLTQKFFGK